MITGQSVINGPGLRVASYNIRKAVGLDWRRNAGRIVDVLREIDADIVVLQEADKRAGRRAGVLPLDRLADELGYRLADVALRPDSHGWHGNAILYRAGRADLADSGRLLLPTLEPRGGVSALFQTPAIEVLGVHLALTAGMRLRQCSMLKTYAEQAAHPVLIAGDFNLWRGDGAVSRLFGDAFTIITPGNTFHTARPIAPLDRFILKGVLGYAGSHVHRSSVTAKASDHLPIVINLNLADLSSRGS